MGTVIITDGKYRASIAAARALGRAGFRVVVTQTKEDSALEPPVFTSCFVSEGRWIEGKASDPDYPDRLLLLLQEYDHPVLFCIGATTLNVVSRKRKCFRQICDFLIAPPEILDQLNDKETVHHHCEELGIPVPKQYAGEPESYPVVIKPHCGEKFGLKARDRYRIANTKAEYEAAVATMQTYDPIPIVQQKVDGDGAGVSLLLDQESRLICAVCHRRLREYPASGGPSTCCESFYDKDMIDRAYQLLRSFQFVGMAMVEFKGPYVLEVNPRVWGSFPLTEHVKSPFACRYAQAAAGLSLEYESQNYQCGVRMRFLLNDTVATLNYLRYGRPDLFVQGIADMFRAEEALSCRDDPVPMRRYLRNNLLRR